MITEIPTYLKDCVTDILLVYYQYNASTILQIVIPIISLKKFFVSHYSIALHLSPLE